MEQLQNYLKEMSFYLNDPSSISIVFGVFAGLLLLAVALRIVVCVGWQTQYALFKFNAKEIVIKADLGKIKLGILKNVINDYMRTAEKNTSGVHLEAITQKYILRLSFIGWSFDSMERFITGLDWALPVAGLVLAVSLQEYRILFSVAAVGAFLLLRIFAAVFDFQLVRQKLLAEIVEYVEREVGQYYAGDFGTVLLRFKNELSTAIAKQSESLREVISKLEGNLSGAVQLTVKEMSAEMAGIGGALNKPLQAWGAAIADAAAAQQKSADAIRGLEEITVKMRAASEFMEASLQNQARYIEKNQALLEESAAHYETNLKQMTQKMGDGFGSILDFHVQKSYEALHEHLQSHITQVTGANHELMLRLEALFDQLMEQSRGETSAIVNLNDQMNLHFEALDNKIL